MATVAQQTGELNLLGSEVHSDGIPTAIMGCEAILAGSVAVYQPIIQTRQLSAISKRGFAFTLGYKEQLGHLTSRNPQHPKTGWIGAGINASTALELVVVSQGNAYDGTTLTRGDYTLVCVPQVDLPPAAQIYSFFWGQTGALPVPVEGFQHDINGVFAAGDAVALSSTVQDAHTGVGNWSNTLETIIPLSDVNAAAYAALLERADLWSRRGNLARNNRDLPIRTYITARAPYLTGGAGCSLNIIGAYLRGVY